MAQPAQPSPAPVPAGSSAQAAAAAVALPAGVSAGPAMGGAAEYRLANGMRFVLLEDRSQPLVTTNVVYLVGSRNEGYGEAGMAHLLEHMLFKGTPKHPEIKAEFTSRGARWNGTTSYDRTNYFLTFDSSRENLTWALALEADRMINSTVSRADLDSEMTVVRNEFEIGENSPDRVLAQRVAHAAFEWHNYGRAIIGARSDIENVPIERLQAFYHRYYQPDNAVMVIAGDFDSAEVLKLIAADFGAIAKPTRVLPRTYTYDSPQDGEREVFLRRKGDSQSFMAIYHAPAGTDPGYAAIDMLAFILGDTPTGRLHKALVETKLATSVSGWDRQLRENGAMQFSASAPKEAPAAPIRKAMLETIEGLAKDPIRADEVERAKQRALTQMDMLLTKTHEFATSLTDWIAIGDWRYFFRYRDSVYNLTVDDVNQAARTYLIPSNRTFGEFIPADQTPQRAAIPPAPDPQVALQNYAGPPGIGSGEAFELTPANIDARTQRFTLSNGLQVALLPKKSRGGMVSAQISFQFGTEQSKFGRGPACGYAGNMLMRGTVTKTREQIRNEITRLRANLSVGGGGASLEVPSTTLEASLTLIADILQHPRFDAAEFEQLRRASIAGIESARSEPGPLSGLALARYLNPYPRGHWAYSPTLDEQLEDARGVGLDDVKRCFNDFYGLSNAQLAVVGDFDAAVLKPVLETLFGTWQSKQPYERIPNRARQAAPMDETIATPDKANAILRGNEVFDMRDDDPAYPALVLANYLFGGSIDARLAKRIREKDGLSYSTGSSISVAPLDRYGSWSMSALFAPQNRVRVETAFREELERARRDGFSAEEVARAKQAMMQQRKLSRASDLGLAGKLTTDLYLHRTYDWEAQFEKNLLALTPEQVNAAFVKYIDPAKINLVRAGDFK
ncbi:MAG TPA: pitrilysin family protein [Burkholderiales bacterium]|jgi:zinc protease|nr:pitrilysin family protein [Burkholderiales bacterium]